MGSICLSSASILRCTPLTNLENILLVIPTALEVFFSTSLLFAKWGQGRRHLLLTAEGWAYLTLTLIELLSNVVPAVRGNLSLFRALDLGIGVASFIPIFFYTFFLFLFTSEELADTLPKRLQNIIKLTLIIFVPAIVIFNEIASFIGVAIRVIPNGNNGGSIIGIGFVNREQEGLWTFFTSLTLALLTVYQASVFCLSFFRLVRAILHQRGIEKKGSDKAHFINGTAWISGAMKLGALETLIGFFGSGFGMSLTRRIMRLLGRAFICIGIVLGVDATEDFQTIQDEIVKGKRPNQNNFRRSRLHQFISNPRFSTFRQLSPTATAFHATPRAPANLDFSSEKSKRVPHYLTTTQRNSQITLQSGLPGMDEFASVKEKQSKKRVTVMYSQGTPRLHMRFSNLEIPTPTPALVADEPKSRPLSVWYEGSEKSRYTVASSYYFHSDQKVAVQDDALEPPLPLFYTERAESEGYRDSFNSAPSSNGGPFEIVDAPQRKLSQKAAQAVIYKASASSASGHNTSQETVSMAPVTIPEATYYPTPNEARPMTQELDSSRVKSMASVKSVPDSLQAVRELAGQFPGPPSPFQYVPEKTQWATDSRSNALYPPGNDVPQVIGSPSELVFKPTFKSPAQQTSAQDIESPVKAGKTPVTPQAGGYRTSSTPRSKAKVPSDQKPIDPFDETSSRQSSQQSIVTLKSQPQLSKLDISTVPVNRTRKAEVPETPEGITPGATSVPIADFRVEDEDAFIDLGMALDTGKSRQFRVTLPPPISPRQALKAFRMSASPKTPTTPRKSLSKGNDKLERIAEWVETSASAGIMPVKFVDAEVPSPVPMPERDNNSNNLQDLHNRGVSIDNLSIPWIKNTETTTQNESKEGRSGSGGGGGSSQKPKLPRLKSVGKVPSKPTPKPTQSRPTRGSLHLEPIVIPPRSGRMPQAVQDVEYGSFEGGRGVLRDAEVLEIEGNVRPKVGQYF